ncbi:MAG TPA: SUMF1/EgtB/PvdO family nonheme iron enzyme [Chthoniobacteraceae bacterium]|jgi:formylglycine-generating enzyme required for sulfatase activity/serine/threonine protein kinase|nr:SUMF1/EgtB/PvdO family nonheme iron enzyme [Chthoniobacteraceae bacterium]
MPAESDIPTELGPAVRALAAGQVVFGRYELQRKLGEGGFGAVWLVYDAALREEVAIKFVLQAVAASPEAIDALKSEAARSRKLTHPNIVRIHDFVSDAVGDAHPDLAGISMEYVDGESLAQRRLREPGKCFDVEQIAPWVDQLCHALTYAHDPKRRVIHRDLKPANLLLTSDGELKVADFGIACSLITSVTQISGRVGSGTPPFMSPQQLGGGWPSESDDVYSLGATIYMLLTGTPPFFQGDIVEQVKHKVPESMSERRARLNITVRAAIPPAWEKTVAACLAKDTAPRPVGAEAVSQRLGLRPGFAPPAPAPKPEVIRIPPEPIDEADTRPAPRPAEIPMVPASPGVPNVAPHRVAPSAPPATAVVIPAAPGRWSRKWLAVPLVVLLLALGYAVQWSNFGAGPPPQPTPPLATPAPLIPTPAVSTPPQQVSLLPSTASKDAPFENSLGMRFVPAGTPGVLFSVWETRVQDYEIFATKTKRKWEKPGFTQGPTHPAVNVSWDDAKAFCEWLSEKEGRTYRLPTDAEWSTAVGLAKETGKTPKEKNRKKPGGPWGLDYSPPQGFGNYAPKVGVDSFEKTAPVGSFAPSPFGLYDLSGNVSEWCEDCYDEEQPSRVSRGGSFADLEFSLGSSARSFSLPWAPLDTYGFRCVLSVSGEPTPQPANRPSLTPQVPIVTPKRTTPLTADTPRNGPETATKDAPFENSLSMRFVPAGAPAVLFSIWETRVQDYEVFATETKREWEKPSFTQGRTHPAVNVSWEDAKAFCEWLSKKEGRNYRLPTDAEWSAAVGLEKETGSTPNGKDNGARDHPWGPAFPPPKDFGNYGPKLQVDSFEKTAPVGSFAPNPFGLYDLSGNVWEWCEDWYDAKQTFRVLRGGSWENDEENNLLSSSRFNDLSTHRCGVHGFRCVLLVSGI